MRTRIHDVDIVKGNAIEQRDDMVLARMAVQVRDLELGHLPAQGGALAGLDLLFCSRCDDVGSEQRKLAEAFLAAARFADPCLARDRQLVEGQVEQVVAGWCIHAYFAWVGAVVHTVVMIYVKRGGVVLLWKEDCFVLLPRNSRKLEMSFTKRIV